MKDEGKIERVAELVITVEMLAGVKTQVAMKSYSADLDDICVAVEFLVWLVARESGLSIKKVMKMIQFGAEAYRPAAIQMPKTKKRWWKRRRKNECQGTKRAPLQI